MTPAIPAGYRRLRVGEKRPKGYKYQHNWGGHWYHGFAFGLIITRKDTQSGPYIAPVARKGGKKGRAK